MASDRLRRISDGTAAFNRGEFDEALDLLGDEIEWDTTTLLPDGVVYRGRDEVKAYFIDVWDRWDDFRIVPEDWLESGDCVVMLGRLLGKGSGSGVPIEAPWHQVWRFEGDRLVRCENYNDRDEALRAAGVGPRSG
jgi:ketosteroid isomerase-like protein